MRFKSNFELENIWLILITGIPSLFIFLTFNTIFNLQNFKSNGLINGLILGLGLSIGYGIYSYLIHKNNRVKILSVFCIIIIGSMSLVISKKIFKVHLATCEICGYKAIKKSKYECQYCGFETWEKAVIEGETNKNKWLIKNQISCFELDVENEKDFYEPLEDAGYYKDTAWKPIISIHDILD